MSDLFPGIPTEIQWIPSFGSIVSSEEDSSQIGRCPNVLRKISFIDDKLTMSYHNSTIWVSIWIIQSEVNSWRRATKFQGISTKKIFLPLKPRLFLNYPKEKWTWFGRTLVHRTSLPRSQSIVCIEAKCVRKTVLFTFSLSSLSELVNFP